MPQSIESHRSGDYAKRFRRDSSSRRRDSCKKAINPCCGARTTTTTTNCASPSYYRGENETQWKLLKDKLDQKFYSWDTTSLPDGAYYLRIVASDAPSNPPAVALEHRPREASASWWTILRR